MKKKSLASIRKKALDRMKQIVFWEQSWNQSKHLRGLWNAQNFRRVVASGFDDKVKAEEAAQKIAKKTGANCIVKKIGSEVKKN